jgi:hypothetical protein
VLPWNNDYDGSPWPEDSHVRTAIVQRGGGCGALGAGATGSSARRMARCRHYSCGPFLDGMRGSFRTVSMSESDQQKVECPCDVVAACIERQHGPFELLGRNSGDELR